MALDQTLNAVLLKSFKFVLRVSKAKQHTNMDSLFGRYDNCISRWYLNIYDTPVTAVWRKWFVYVKVVFCSCTVEFGSVE